MGEWTDGPLGRSGSVSGDRGAGQSTAAARQLHRSLQSINRSLAALESSVGAELIRRSTRRSNPTEAGMRYYRRHPARIFEIDAARRELATKHSEPSGVLRIAAPVLFASTYVAPAVCDFLSRHPNVEATLTASDNKVDMYEGRFDLAVRIRELPDSGLKSRRIGELRVVTFGAARYFAKHGRPKHPSELERHQCIVRSTDPEAEKWWYRIRRKARARSGGRSLSHRRHAVRQLAVAAGLGIGMAPLWHIQQLMRSGAWSSSSRTSRCRSSRSSPSRRPRSRRPRLSASSRTRLPHVSSVSARCDAVRAPSRPNAAASGGPLAPTEVRGIPQETYAESVSLTSIATQGCKISRIDSHRVKFVCPNWHQNRSNLAWTSPPNLH